MRRFIQMSFGRTLSAGRAGNWTVSHRPAPSLPTIVISDGFPSVRMGAKTTLAGVDVGKLGICQFPLSSQGPTRENRFAEPGAQDGDRTHEIIVRGQKNAGSTLPSGQLAEECFIDGVVDAETMDRHVAPGNFIQNGSLVADLSVHDENDMGAALHREPFRHA